MFSQGNTCIFPWNFLRNLLFLPEMLRFCVRLFLHEIKKYGDFFFTLSVLSFYFSAESFGSLLQNYTPSSSLSAPSIDDVLHNFPRTDTVIASPCETSPIRSPVKEVTAIQFYCYRF